MWKSLLLDIFYMLAHILNVTHNKNITSQEATHNV